jgi:hypothetical protein
MHVVGDDIRASSTEDTTRDEDGTVGAQRTAPSFDKQRRMRSGASRVILERS